MWLLALHLSLGLSWFDYTLGDFLRPLLVGMDEDESWDEIADGHVELGAGRALRPGGGGGAQATTGNTHRFEVFSLASLQRTPQRAALLLLGVGAVPLFLRVLNVFSNHQKLGILMIILRKMIYDVVLFGVIAIIIAVGFGLAFVVVIRTQSAEWVHVWEERGEEQWDLKRVLQMPFWAMVGENSYDFMSETSPYIGTPLLWFYIVIAQILLVNLLIAMMNSTYTNYTDQAQQEYYFDRVRSLVETDTLFPVPPPLNLPALVLRKLW